MDYLYLFLTAFLSATFLPLGSEALLIYDIAQGLNIYYLLLYVTIGNVLGSCLNYFLGVKGEEYLLKKNYIDKKKFEKGKKYFDKYGAYSLLLSWAPIIGDPITFVAGVMRYKFLYFVTIVLFAKFVRYLILVLIYYNT